MLLLYLLSCSHSSIAGAFRLPDGYAAEDLKWSPERVGKAFEELLANGFANRCRTTNWVWVIEHFQSNQLDNPNQVKSAAKWAATIPSQCAWIQAYMRVCGPLLGLSPPAECEPLANPLPTVLKPVSVSVAVAETGTGTGEKAGAPAAPPFALTSAIDPKKRKSQTFDASLIDLPDWLDRKLWCGWVADRRERKKPITERAAAEQVKTLDKLRLAGNSPESVISHAIAGGYQGLFPPPAVGADTATRPADSGLHADEQFALVVS